MNRRLPLALAAAAAAFALLASSATAGTTHRHHPSPPPSAFDVYVEQVPTASGPKPVTPPKQSGSTGQASQSYVPLSSNATSQLRRQGGKDKKVLKTIATSPALGVGARLSASGASSVKSPSAIGAAFGSGSGPKALFLSLLAVAILLLAAGKLRGRRS